MLTQMVGQRQKSELNLDVVNKIFNQYQSNWDHVIVILNIVYDIKVKFLLNLLMRELRPVCLLSIDIDPKNRNNR
jgi:hypothetical protein